MGAVLYWIGWGVVVLLLPLWAVSVAARAVEWAWWRPRRLERLLREQGIRGSPYRLLYGDTKEEMRLVKEARSKPMTGMSHDIAPRVVPFQRQAVSKFGKFSFTWFGPHPTVIIADPELIREILSNKFGHFEKPNINALAKLLARGVATYEGEKWAKHRRIINPAFHIEKLKRMLPAFSASCNALVDRWEKLIGSEPSYELDVSPELQNLTGDVISRTAFGSSYEEGKRIFQLQSEQAKLIIQTAPTAYIPGYRFLPTKENIRMKEIHIEVKSILRSMIEKRVKAMESEDTDNDDLLGLLLETNLKHSKQHKNSHTSLTIDEVIDECKLFYIAGQETTNVLLTWTMIMLSVHPNWQASARDEVSQVFGKDKPNFDGLNHLKIVTMILYEVLRLYPAATQLMRSTYKAMKLGNFTFPAGVQLLLPTLLIHHNPEYWGEDAQEFKPERFAEGVAKAAKNQVAYFPFGWGPRMCIGQNFSVIEAKIALAMILQRFSFELSPSYVHAPYTVLTLQPQYGAPIILHKL